MANQGAMLIAGLIGLAVLPKILDPEKPLVSNPFAGLGEFFSVLAPTGSTDQPSITDVISETINSVIGALTGGTSETDSTTGATPGGNATGEAGPNNNDVTADEDIGIAPTILAAYNGGPGTLTGDAFLGGQATASANKDSGGSFNIPQVFSPVLESVIMGAAKVSPGSVIKPGTYSFNPSNPFPNATLNVRSSDGTSANKTTSGNTTSSGGSNSMSTDRAQENRDIQRQLSGR
jgi:hypothetical protein